MIKKGTVSLLRLLDFLTILLKYIEEIVSPGPVKVTALEAVTYKYRLPSNAVLIEHGDRTGNTPDRRGEW